MGPGELAANLPLHTGGEAGAAAALQTGGLDLVNNLLGRHRGQHLCQCCIAVIGNILVNVFGVDDAAVPQGNPNLILIEGSVGKGGCLAGLVDLAVNKARNGAALEDMLLHNLLNILGGDVAVEHALGIDHNVGTLGAQAETSGLDHPHLFIQVMCLQLLFKLRDDAGSTCGFTAGTGTDKDMGSYKIHIMYLLILLRRWCTPSPPAYLQGAGPQSGAPFRGSSLHR